jgi:hypothetical protein
MLRSAKTSKDAQILFCPYCRDGFEGVAECPEHELTLVPIHRLPRRRGRFSNEVGLFIDPRLGRGGVLLGAALVLAGFVLPFAGARGVEASALEVAIDGATNLWLTPIAAVVMLWVLWMRRTRQGMRAARLAVLGLAVAGALPLIYTCRRIGLVADAYTTDVQWLWGLGIMAAGLVAAALGSMRLGGAAESSGD